MNANYDKKNTIPVKATVFWRIVSYNKLILSFLDAGANKQGFVFTSA